jgi:CDP-diacylglycerol---glycerol-3-phosphate 3-phosphatidyltransferase
VPLPPASSMAFMTANHHTASGRSVLCRFGRAALRRYNDTGSRATAGFSMNLPNSLTLSRIFLVPLLVVVLLTKFEGRQILGVDKDLVAAAIFGIASITDWLDGFLARRRKQITPLGQMMDPLADKLLTSAAFISLVQMELAPAWMVAVIIGRELAITALRSIGYSRGINIPASPMGKVKMIAEVVAILAMILGPERTGRLSFVGIAALWVAVITAVISAVDYYRKFARGTGSDVKVKT